MQQEKEAGRRRIVAGSLVAVAISTGLWLRARHEQKLGKLNEANSLGRNSLLLLNQGKNLDALMAAIQAGKILHKYKTDDPEVMNALITNIREGGERNRLEDHDSWVNSVSFSPDGQTLASGSDDNTIKLWDLRNLNFDYLMGRSCDSIRSYLLYNPNVEEKDRDLCDGIGTEQ